MYSEQFQVSEYSVDATEARRAEEAFVKAKPERILRVSEKMNLNR